MYAQLTWGVGPDLVLCVDTLLYNLGVFKIGLAL